MKTLDEAAQDLATAWRTFMQLAVVEPLGRVIEGIANRMARSAAEED